MTGLARWESLGEILPWRSRAENPENRFEDLAGGPLVAARIRLAYWQGRLDDRSPHIGELHPWLVPSLQTGIIVLQT